MKTQLTTTPNFVFHLLNKQLSSCCFPPSIIVAKQRTKLCILIKKKSVTSELARTKPEKPFLCCEVYEVFSREAEEPRRNEPEKALADERKVDG